jgi:hypothetical protein
MTFRLCMLGAAAVILASSAASYFLADNSVAGLLSASLMILLATAMAVLAFCVEVVD